MKITSVESFRVEVPFERGQQDKVGYYHSTGITRLRTDAGITGYGFSQSESEPVSRILVGQDPFAIERHLEAGLDQWYGAENALWDIAGKAAGLPLCRLWGMYRSSMPVYLTCVWPRGTDITPRQQAEEVRRYAEAGYRAVKLQIHRPDFMEDVEVVRLIRQLVGGRERMEVMLDRTGQYSGNTWDYATALKAARALEEVEATWLEEPFVRGDVELSARLRQEVDLAITGGEHQPFSVYPGYIKGGSFDILQPHCANVFRHLKAVADMAESFGMECIFHGSHGMDLIGAFQVGATIRTCRTLELVYTAPPVLPEQAWAPLGALVKGGNLFVVKDGCVEVPQAPGLGVELDEEAIERYRVG